MCRVVVELDGRAVINVEKGVDVTAITCITQERRWCRATKFIS